MRWIIWFWQMPPCSIKSARSLRCPSSAISLLKETIAPYQIAALVATFCGCLLIIKPTGAGGELFPMLVALLGGISAGGASTMLRLLGKYGVKKSLIVFVFSLFSLLTAAPFLIFDYHPMTMQQIAMLLLAGVSAALGQFSVTNAYAFAPAREISVFDYSQVVFFGDPRVLPVPADPGSVQSAGVSDRLRLGGGHVPALQP